MNLSHENNRGVGDLVLTNYGGTDSAAGASGLGILGNLNHLPEEMRERRQWCVAGASKAPLSMAHGKLFSASVTQPEQWMDFDTAVRVAWDHKDLVTTHTIAKPGNPERTITQTGLHLGYVLHESDPFACIDLDVKDQANAPDEPELWTTPAQYELFKSIVAHLNSYTEMSRSGKGIHIWVMGKVGKGLKREGVELYSQERFIICTGNVISDKDIEPRQEMLNNMASQMRRPDNSIQLEEVESDLEDLEIIDKLMNAVNRDKFNELCRGDWKGMGYPSQSEADLALMSMFCFHSKSNEQCRRLFRMTELGKREKAIKNDVNLNRTLRVVRGRMAQEQHAIKHGETIAARLLANWQAEGRGAQHSSGVTTDLSAFSTVSSDRSGAELLNELSVDWFGDVDADVSDIIAGLVADEDVTLLGGHGGVGKSFLTLQMACAVATGHPVLNHGTRQNRVLYYSAEDGKKRLIRRLKSMTEAFAYDRHTLKQNLVVVDASELEPLYGESAQNVGDAQRPHVMKILGPRADFRNLQKMVEVFDPQLLIVDGASDTFDGNEIARRDVRAFIKLLRRVHPHRKIGVLVTVHIDRASARGSVSNDDGYAGSGQWHNSCRRRMYLQVRKEKGEGGEEIGEKIMLRVMKNQDGAPVPDMEVERGPYGLWRLAAQGESLQSDTVGADQGEALLALIADYYQQGIYISASLANNSTTGVYPTLSGDKSFPTGLGKGRTAMLVRQLERERRLLKEKYRRIGGGEAERWKVAE